MNSDPNQNQMHQADRRGRRHWRSLEELWDTPEFRASLEREFPDGAAEWPDSDAMGRRQFLSLIAGSLALAGLAGCTPRSREKIVPYVDQPEQIIPGKPLIYASAMPLNGYGRGILVETQMGRPVKIEGNPAHPDSLGATDPFTQAAILDLWDPDRAQAPMLEGNESDWDEFESELVGILTTADRVQGAGLALLTEFSTSPTLHRQMAELLKKYPKAKWYQSAPASSVRQPVPPETDFGKLDLIVSVGSDFLIDQPASLRFTRQFASRRRVEGGQVRPNRLYVLESTPTLTGTMADHRLSAPPDRIAAVLRHLGGARAEKLHADEERFAQNLAADLAANSTSSIVITGETEPREIRTLAAALGRTPVSPVTSFPEDQLPQLAADLDKGLVRQLLILGGNPVYTAPACLRFAELLAKASFTAHLSLLFNETSQRCRWQLPETHFLEAWSDILASDGTPTIIQPVIDPLYGGRSIHELIALLAGTFRPSGYDTVRMTWAAGVQNNFEAFWKQSIHDGVVKAPSPVAAQAGANGAHPGAAVSLSADTNYLLIRPDPTIGDGRWANNGWLQELPKPITKLTWDNAALVGPAMAHRLGVKTGEVVQLGIADQSIDAPVIVVPGQPDRCVTIHLGYGRTVAGHLGTGLGFAANRFQTIESPWIAAGLTIRKTGARHKLAFTQHHFNVEGRDIVRVADLKEFRADPYFAAPKLAQEPSLLPSAPPLGHGTYAWGMTVDLSICTGCNACVTACQAENNIPVVGKDQVAAGREMQWIRIDQYFEGTPEDPSVLHQPVLCMHCEKAPCEIVCPVAATVHNDEGLNTMIYNRCVGTRFCSNNCPYKVRRFNFLEYSPPANSSLAQRQNPNVTVRRRGVMEKCTYCVQRINEARITAENQNRKIRDGEILTACQQACPAQAIVFGNMLNSDSLVSRRKREPVNYGLLAELNTAPRTTYLARIRNPREANQVKEHS